MSNLLGEASCRSWDYTAAGEIEKGINPTWAPHTPEKLRGKLGATEKGKWEFATQNIWFGAQFTTIVPLASAAKQKSKAQCNCCWFSVASCLSLPQSMFVDVTIRSKRGWRSVDWVSCSASRASKIRCFTSLNSFSVTYDILHTCFLIKEELKNYMGLRWSHRLEIRVNDRLDFGTSLISEQA